MRRGVGVAGLRRQQEHQATLRQRGEEMETDSINAMQQSLEQFQAKLAEFAVKHKENINKNPIFRQQFTKMCKTIGVDPLASNKAVWATTLGHEMTDFYYELGIHIIEACLKTKQQNGGIISVEDLIQAIENKKQQKLRLTTTTTTKTPTDLTPTSDISKSDIKSALDQIAILGNGYRMLEIGGVEMVVSVPVELQTDHIDIMRFAAANHGWVDVHVVQNIGGKHWTPQRVQAAVNALAQEGMCWVDEQASKDGQDAQEQHSTTERYCKWWIPSIWLDRLHNQ